MLLPLVSVHSNHSSIAMGVKGRSEPPFAVSLWTDVYGHSNYRAITRIRSGSTGGPGCLAWVV